MASIGDQPALVVRDLHKAFGEVHALDGMSWTAPAGQISALLGPNGAGKTTALRCIAGVLRPDRGAVTILGRPAAAGADGISFLPEQPELYPALTVAEHLRFVALAHRLDRRWRDRADALATRFELDGLLGEVPGELSQGQRRKAALVAALLHGARVLLFDEPFNGLDPKAVSELRQVLVDLAADGVAVVVSTHVLASAERFIDRAVVVDRGRSCAEGTMDELRRAAGTGADADLEELFLALTGHRPDDVPQGGPHTSAGDPGDR